jgi:HNH endonuclease
MNIIEKFMIKVSKPDGENGCWIWTGYLGKRKNKNYGHCHLLPPEQMAHRVSYILFNGPIPEGMQILHNCDNPPCVNPNHIRSGTAQDNVNDRVNRGRSRHPSGTEHGRSKLTSNQIAKIRSSYVPGKAGGKRGKPGALKNSARYLAEKYGVTKRTILLIIRNESYKTP